jgi:hypothetical protein
MGANVIVWDVETVPDLKGFAAANRCNGKTDDDIRASMGDKFPKQLDQRIAMIRQNINDLVEQAAAFSGAGDESRTADRIAQQEHELARLTKLRDNPSRKSDKP